MSYSCQSRNICIQSQSLCLRAISVLSHCVELSIVCISEEKALGELLGSICLLYRSGTDEGKPMTVANDRNNPAQIKIIFL